MRNLRSRLPSSGAGGFVDAVVVDVVAVEAVVVVVVIVVAVVVAVVADVAFVAAVITVEGVVEGAAVVTLVVNVQNQ